MKIGSNISGFDVSSRGLSIQRKKMNLIAENIANADTVNAENGQPYKRQFLEVVNGGNSFGNQLNIDNGKMRLNITNSSHISAANTVSKNSTAKTSGEDILFDVKEDKAQGDVVFMPDNPNADEQGYVELSNVNIITEMVEMISASRSYEANLTAFNASKQMAKDALEI